MAPQAATVVPLNPVAGEDGNDFAIRFILLILSTTTSGSRAHHSVYGVTALNCVPSFFLVL
jgi:hypothetical protein